MTLDQFKLITDILQNTLASIGIVIAGIWTLWTFVLNRTYSGQLTITISNVNNVQLDSSSITILHVKIKNIGHTRITKGKCRLVIDPIDCTVLPDELSSLLPVPPDYTNSNLIFKTLETIEPNEEVDEEIAMVINSIRMYRVGVSFSDKKNKNIWENTAFVVNAPDVNC